MRFDPDMGPGPDMIEPDMANAGMPPAMDAALPHRLPVRGRAPPKGGWSFYIRAWRPFCGWLIALLLVRAIVVPIVQLIRREPVEPLDWTALSALAGVLFIARSYDRTQGFA